MPAKTLVIVESPAKCGKINGFLGNNFIVKASFGHFRDLAKGLKAIDIPNGFAPTYCITKAKVVRELRDWAKKCSEVVIASDLDREGEAIGWHVAHILKLDPATTKRIVFNQITKKAVCEAMAAPKTLDMNLVNAQQARRILDRLVGFELSPLLWRHVQSKLSAGRCQSPALRLVYDREKEIESFQSSGYFETIGIFRSDEHDLTLEGTFNNKYETKELAMALLKDCQTAKFQLTSLTKKESKNNPPAPYTTSTLQQDASNKCGMPPKVCMQVAQKLYEAGKITYMRTDSLDLSPEAMGMCKKHVLATYGKKNYQARKFKSKSANSQEAHEAIRPVYIDTTKLTGSHSPQEKKLYQMIHQRTVASQMKPSVKDIFTGKISMDTVGRKDIVICKYDQLTFLGYLEVYGTTIPPPNEKMYELLQNSKTLLPIDVYYTEITSNEKFTKSLGRYNEATLIKELEKRGIGRPSTFSNLISTIQERGYVKRETRKGRELEVHIMTLKPASDGGSIQIKTKKTTAGNEKNKLFITTVGRVTIEFLVKHFDNILNYGFTGSVEQELDKIANGSSVWNQVVGKVYESFHPKVVELSDRENSTREKHNLKRELGQNTQGEVITVYLGKYGPVIQIGNHAEHKNNRFCSIPEEIQLESITLEQALALCVFPKTLGQYKNKDVVVKKGRYGYYMVYGGGNVSIPNVANIDINAFALADATAILEQGGGGGSKSNNVIKEFTKELVIRKGPYGNYIRHKNKNISLPKNYTEPEKLTKEEVMEIIKEVASKPKRKYAKKKK
jgi:DNA topoisomerase-1